MQRHSVRQNSTVFVLFCLYLSTIYIVLDKVMKVGRPSPTTNIFDPVYISPSKLLHLTRFVCHLKYAVRDSVVF